MSRIIILCFGNRNNRMTTRYTTNTPIPHLPLPCPPLPAPHPCTITVVVFVYIRVRCILAEKDNVYRTWMREICKRKEEWKKEKLKKKQNKTGWYVGDLGEVFIISTIFDIHMDVNISRFYDIEKIIQKVRHNVM